MKNWFDLIEIKPEDNKAYIKGTPVKVGEILESLESGHSLDQIVESNPLLNREAVRAAISFRDRFNYAYC
jgi:uncharacterized protein (DUF433 family)